MTAHSEDWNRVQSAILGLEWTEAKQAALDRLAAYIERLEAERDALLASNKCGIHESCSTCHHENSNDEKDERTCIQALHDEYHALLAEHEAGIEMRAFIDHGYGWTRVDIDRYKAAHDNAERVIRG